MNNNPLTNRRKEMGISQREVAEYLNITQQHYSRIEKGDGDYAPYLNKLCKFYKCKKDELWQGNYLDEVYDAVLNDFSRVEETQFREEKPDAVYLNLKGWFTKEELKDLNTRMDNSIKDWNKYIQGKGKK
jgi:transcriptional regulator with XRE-family HTH domain